MSEFTLGKRGQFVKQRLDEDGVDDLHDQCEYEKEGHEGRNEPVTSPVNDLEECSEDRNTNDSTDSIRLELISDPETP